ncbi:MAG: hypothetical protein D6698_10365 [Gammaproteobacteria bacterium]|nr:MAG: hypothetical protein D6698_10365 [Gammaproteobacteria bacterium]
MITIRRSFLFSQPGKWAIQFDASCVTFDQLSGEVTDPSEPVEIVAHFDTRHCMDTFSGKLVKYNDYGRPCAEFPLSYANLCDKTANVSITIDGSDYVISDNTPNVVARTWKVDITLFQYVSGDSHSQTIRLRPMQPVETSLIKLSQVFADGCTNEDEFFLSGASFTIEATSAALVEVQQPTIHGCDACQQGVSYLTPSGGVIDHIDVQGLPNGVCYQFLADQNMVVWAAPPGIAGTYPVTIKAWSENGQLAMAQIGLNITECTQADAVTYQPTMVELMCSTLDSNNRVDSRITSSLFGNVDWSTFTVISAPAWVNVVSTPSAILFEAVSQPAGTVLGEVVWSIKDTSGRTWQFSTPVKSVVSGSLTYPPPINICVTCSELTEPVDLRTGITPQPTSSDMVFGGDPEVVAVRQGEKWSFYVRPDNNSINPIVTYKGQAPDGCPDSNNGVIVLRPVCVGVSRGVKDLTCETNKVVNLLDLVTLTVYHPFQNYTFEEVTTAYTGQGGTITAAGDVDFTNMAPGTYTFRITAERNDFTCTPPMKHSVEVQIRIDDVAAFPYDTKDTPLTIIWPSNTYSSPIIHIEGSCRQYKPATDSGVALPSGWTAAADMWVKTTKGTTDKTIKVTSAGIAGGAAGLQVAIYDLAMTLITQATGSDTVTFDTSTLGLTVDNAYLIRIAPTTPGAIKIEIV